MSRYRCLMSFGYSVGDFIAVGALAWDVYRYCKGAPESFGNISSEVLSLYAVLKEAEETVYPATPIATQAGSPESSWRWMLSCAGGSAEACQEVRESGNTGQENLGSDEMGH
jgi:hypothetical protein